MDFTSAGTTNKHLLMAAVALIMASWLAIISPNPLVLAVEAEVPSLPGVRLPVGQPSRLSGKVEVRSTGPDILFNTKKVVHAAETFVPLLKFRLQAINNHEPLRVQKLYLQIRGPQNTLNNFILYDEDSRSALTMAVQPSWSSSGQGEVRFVGLSVPLALNGGEKMLSVRADTVAPAVMQSNSNVTVGVKYLEYIGRMPSAVVRTTITNPGWSENIHLEEVEPVIISLQVGVGNQVQENPLGVFVVAAQGSRDLLVNTLRFEVSGTYNTSQGFGPRNFKLDRADSRTGARTPDPNLNFLTPFEVGSGRRRVIGFNLPTPDIIGAGSSKGYMLIADTTHLKDDSLSDATAETTVRLLGRRADEIRDNLAGTTDGLTWSYTRSNGALSPPHTISDSYIVTGKSILYL